MHSKLQNFLGESWNRYREVFLGELDSRIPLLNQINKYITDRGGKQLRPILSLLSAIVCCGECNDKVIRCAAASEMIHTATLFHDDVADGSSMRRGASTLNSLYSPSTAVLVGDYWLSKAICSLLSHCSAEIFTLFAKTLSDLAEGEMIQMERAQTLETTFEDYISIIERKTASLFCASMRSAAIAANATAEQCDALYEYAYHLGIAFQMRDDILDYSPEFATGKPIGQDIKEGKITLPLLGALSNSSPKDRKKIKRVFKYRFVQRTLKLVAKNGGLEYAQNVLELEIDRAISALSLFEDSEAKSHLINLARKTVLRTK